VQTDARAKAARPDVGIASDALVPIYEYRCPNGHLFELFQRMGDPAPDGCEVCGEGPVERVLYPVAVHFKGSGFYTTDYGRSSRKREESTDGAKPEKSEKTEKKDKPEKKEKATEA
jgi:putative FmdB family regulatory protein